MTDAQLQTLAQSLRAETDPGVVAALSIRDDYTLMLWCNGASTQDAWAEVDGRTLFELMTITSFDSLTAGKRAAWDLMLSYAPLDFGRKKYRDAMPDIWGSAPSVAMLQGCTRKATRAEAYLGGSAATTNTVTALKLNAPGQVSVNEISDALNRI